MIYGRDESLNSTLETKMILYVNYLEFIFIIFF